MYTKRNQGEKRKKIKFLSPTFFLMVSLVNDTFPTGLAHTHSGMSAHIHVCVRVHGVLLHTETGHRQDAL